MLSGKTQKGFDFSIDERIVNDWRLVEAVHKSEDEDASIMIEGVIELTDLLLGSDKHRFMEYIKEQNEGYIPTEAVAAEITEIFKSLRELKNSQSSQE